MSAPVVSFINMKGGVGKTTLCVGIAEFLANYRHKKILLIDVDPQLNATQSIMGKYNRIEEYIDELLPNEKTIRKVFETKKSISTENIKLTPDQVITQLTDNLDVILGDISIIFDTDQAPIRIQRIKKFISDNDIRNKYDYILIDSPPTISIFTDASLIASDYYLTPIRIDYYSILGAANLMKVIEYLKESFDSNIKHLGFIYTNTHKRQTQKTKKIQKDFESNPMFIDNYFFSNRLSYLRDLMVGGRGNIPSSYTKSKIDIENICNEFENRISAIERNNDE
ncbi:TPA: AAA family ATPase [Morganella morganii]|uniref:AAA family ATPase n=1 Tax=Morganella morganii TaxID=582 RepID=A0A9Q4CTM6_MORMO|nr:MULTISPECIES: AAA family ATPase [Morganella]SSN07582.1 cobyrinic acid a,c-diamide synthase [Klebsiella pneumoniae]EJD6109537.1 AAA family ATPase [Morganella morganii]EJG2207763.1 AAA family ATPase [Morganella morganii]EKU4014152.1 AAA family ATPase [Morganella morganii]EKW8485209.1 AAA family ATPase [Morganella morganii]